MFPGGRACGLLAGHRPKHCDAHRTVANHQKFGENSCRNLVFSGFDAVGFGKRWAIKGKNTLSLAVDLAQD